MFTIGGEVLSEGTTLAGLSCASFSSAYYEWEECARLYWATPNYKIPCPWKRKTCRNLTQTACPVGEATLSWPRVKVWSNEFKQGRERVANQDHPRGPRTSTTNKNIERVREFIEEGLLRSAAVEMDWKKLDHPSYRHGIFKICLDSLKKYL